jgi:hypothetical protein
LHGFWLGSDLDPAWIQRNKSSFWDLDPDYWCVAVKRAGFDLDPTWIQIEFARFLIGSDLDPAWIQRNWSSFWDLDPALWCVAV